jgi:hypothetical protein
MIWSNLRRHCIYFYHSFINPEEGTIIFAYPEPLFSSPLTEHTPSSNPKAVVNDLTNQGQGYIYTHFDVYFFFIFVRKKPEVVPKK